MQSNNVVLPPSLGPTKPTSSPLPTSRLTSWTAEMPSKVFVTERTESRVPPPSPMVAPCTRDPLNASSLPADTRVASLLIPTPLDRGHSAATSGEWLGPPLPRSTSPEGCLGEHVATGSALLVGPLALLVFHVPFGVARVRERAECEEDDGKAACAESTRQVAEQLLDHYEAEAGLDRAFDGPHAGCDHHDHEHERELVVEICGSDGLLQRCVQPSTESGKTRR